VASGGAVTQEDQTLKDAIQASLNEFTDESDVFPIKETVREGGRSVMHRLIHCLLLMSFSVPLYFTCSSLNLKSRCFTI
jgi:hypothetical protein